MAVTKINARGWTFEISDGAATPTWTEIGGINTFSLDRESETTDTTTYDSNGEAEHEVMQRGKTLTLEGFFLEDTVDGTRDAGQSAVETVADAVGSASIREIRATSPGGTVKTFKASAEIGTVGGGNNDKTSWSVTFTRSGATTTT